MSVAVSKSIASEYAPPLSDETLLRLCAQGESKALEELVLRYQAPLQRLMERLLGSPDDAEEALLDVFVRVWQHASRFRYHSRVSTWLYRIAANIARDVYDRRRVRSRDVGVEACNAVVESAEEDFLGRWEHEERARILHGALEKLNASDRLLLVLYYLEECSYDEMQEITALSYTVLKTRLARARRRLRTFLEAEDREAKR